MKIKLLVVGPLMTNCYLLVSGGELLIVDPGGGIKKILKEISQTKAKPKYILNTHCHWDHAFGNKIIKKITGAKILIHEAEFAEASPHLPKRSEGREMNGVQRTSPRSALQSSAKNFIKFGADRFLKEGDEIKIGDSILKVLHTSGHTRGSICLMGKNFVFTGDTLFKDGHGRTDLPGGSQEDLEKSLERLKKILKPGVTVYPGHGEIFKIS